MGRGESTLGNGDVDASVKELQLIEFNIGITAIGVSPFTLSVLDVVMDAVDGIVGAGKELVMVVIVGVVALDRDLRLPLSGERCLFTKDGDFDKDWCI